MNSAIDYLLKDKIIVLKRGKILKTRIFINLYASSNSDTILKRDSFGSDRVNLAKCSVLLFNTKEKQTVEYDLGIILVYLRANYIRTSIVYNNLKMYLNYYIKYHRLIKYSNY